MSSRTRLRCWSMILAAVVLSCPHELFARDVTSVWFSRKVRARSCFAASLLECMRITTLFAPRQKGQTITVKLTTTDRDASFAIYETTVLGPTEDTILPNNETLRLFSGKLPVTSEYSVQVYGVTSIDDQEPSGAAYTWKLPFADSSAEMFSAHMKIKLLLMLVFFRQANFWRKRRARMRRHIR